MPGWLLPASVAFVCWGVWAFLPKFSTRYLPPTHVLVWQTLGVLAVAGAVLAREGFRLQVSGKGIAYAVATGALGLTGALGYLLAVKQAKVATTVAFTAMYPVLTILLGWAILGETPTPREGLGMVFAIAALFCFAI